MPGIDQDNTVSRSLSDTPNDVSGRTARALPNSPLGSVQATTSLPNIVTFAHADSFGSRTSQRALGPESPRTADGGRRSLSYALRQEADVYYDSRAATRDEWKRRDRTLQDYYGNNPQLLPQLPFTWHHGWRRWRLFLFAILVFIDGSLIPIVLYYAMRYAGHVQGWIIFAVVTSIWGGPTYIEFAIRTWRLMKKERFYRPLGTNSRWCFDILHWASVLTITAVTALFIVGSAPHIVWLRVLCMPAPAILYSFGGVLGIITLYNYMNWRAPFRLSSTGKGEKVRLQ